MADSPVNPNPTPGAEGAPPPQAPPPSQPGSKLLTLGILIAAMALVGVWIRKDATKSQTPATAQGDAKSAKPVEVKLGAPAPDLVLKDLQGKTVKLADLKGKVVIVDFWATWCGPCTIMIPWFIEFQKRYGDQGLAIVGVAMDDEGLEAVKPYVEKAKMNYTVLIGNEETADAWGGIFGLPTSFIIDRQGRIQARHVGLISRDTFEQDIRGLL